MDLAGYVLRVSQVADPNRGPNDPFMSGVGQILHINFSNVAYISEDLFEAN
jgi:hypothetical protein